MTIKKTNTSICNKKDKNLYIKNVVNISILLIIFILSLIIGPYYTNGDQLFYRKTYEGLKGLNIGDGFDFYTTGIGSKEFVHFFLSWIASNLDMNKDFFVSISNTLLAYSTVMLLRKWKVSVFIIAILLFTNFYFYVLYFSAERLKFGFIFLMLSFLYVRYFLIFSFLSIISHSQSLILYGAMLFNILVIRIKKILMTGRISLSLTLIIILFITSLFFLIKHIVAKFEYYNSGHDFSDLVKIISFFMLSLYYSKYKSEVVFIFIPLFICIFFIGGDRVNMIGYFVFLYYALPIRNGLNIGVVATSIYFLFASLNFLTKVIEHGDGFYDY